MRFLGGDGSTPDAAVVSGLLGLNQLPIEHGRLFIAAVVAFVAAPQTTDLIDELRKFSSASGVKKKGAETLARSWLLFFKGALKFNLTVAHIKEDLAALGLEAAVSDAVGEVWARNLAQVSSTHLVKTLTVNRLVDMQYKFGVTSSCRDVEKVGSTFLQMKFVLDNGREHQEVVTEMSLPQFYQFLAQMERAKAVMDGLST